MPQGYYVSRAHTREGEEIAPFGLIEEALIEELEG